MKKAEFDKFADEYAQQHARNIAITGEGPDFFAEYKVADASRWCCEGALAPRAILDFGAGIGNSLPHFRKHFPRSELLCADVSERSLALARERFSHLHKSILISNNQLPLENNSVDLAFTACVFHHIEHGQHAHWLREIYRVVRPGGMLILFEHNPWNPLTVRAVNTCPFDANARLISNSVMAQRAVESGWIEVKTRFRIFFPRAFSRVRPLEHWMYWLPLGAQYALVCRRGSV